jgi:hypothetical protein
MNTIQEQLTSALRRRDAELTVHDEVDAILNDDHLVRFNPQRDPRSRRPILLTVAAASTLAVGAGGLMWAQRTAPPPPATADSPRATLPASFPRLQFPVGESVTEPVLVVQGDRTITISDRTQGMLRFVWSEAPGVFVVVDTYLLSQEAAMAAIETLQPVEDVVWQQRLDAIPALEVVRSSTDRDAIWTLYLGAAIIDDQLDTSSTGSPGHDNC